MKVIGLTGGIGSGKSTVAGFLSELDAVIIDADKLGHEALAPGTEVWREIVAAFGQEVLNRQGNIDRNQLGDRVFGRPQALAQLNRIIQPRINDMVKSRLKQYREQGAAVAVLEAALLFEEGDTELVDEIWVTVAVEATVIKRLEERSGLTASESLSRIRSQMSNEERIRRADVVINTDCSLADLKDRINTLWRKLAGSS